MKKKLDYSLIGCCTFFAVIFNVLMTRGCDTFGWSVVIMVGTLLIFCFPFLPEDWIKIILDEDGDTV